MIVLRTLGSIDINAPGQPRAAEVLAQPKRFTLLVYIALTEPKGFVRRDSLLPLFWPEADQARGRQVLRQTIYLLRQQLGAEAIPGRGGEELGVDAGALRCDATLFESALAEGRTADALELYRGDFLAGLHVPEASTDLEEWISQQRRRLKNLAMRGAWALAVHEERDGHAPAATFWAQRAVAFDPTDETGVRDLMRLLARTGDRGGALRAYEEFSRRLQEELGAEPGREIAQVAEGLRRGPGAVAPAEPGVALPVAPAAPRTGPDTVAPARVRRGVPWRAVAAALVLMLAAGGAAIAALRRGPSAPLLAVGPITTLAAGDSSRLSTVTSDLLSTSVARLSNMRVIPVTRLYELQGHLRAAGDTGATMNAAAAQAGADQLLQGTVHHDERGGGLTLDVQIVELKNGAVVHAYRATGADLFAMVDDATTLIARGYGVPSPRERIADVTTQSMVAYRLYVEGLQAYRREDLPVGYRLFLAALNEDSTFAMAAHYAGLASPNDSLRSVWGLKAAGLADRATDRERLWILEQVANETYSPLGFAVAETLAVRYPEDLESRMALGDIALERGDFAGAARHYREVVRLDSLSLVAIGPHEAQGLARCLACQAYDYMFLSELAGDSLAAAERDTRVWALVQADHPSVWGRMGEALAREGRYAEALAAFGKSYGDSRSFVDFEAAQLDVRAGNYDSADRRLTRQMASTDPSLAGEGSWFLAISLRDQGRWREALALSRSHGPSLQEGIALLEMGQGAEAARFFRRWDAHIRPRPGLPGVYAKQHAWILTHVATSLAAAGDTASLVALADTIQASGAQSAFGRDPLLHHYVRGLLWRARGDLPKAIEEFRASIWSWTIGYTRENYELARALVDAGRPAEAVYPLQAALRGDLQSSNLWVTRTELHELLARAFAGAGQADSARVHWRAVASAWRGADANVRPRWQEAEKRSAELALGASKDWLAAAYSPTVSQPQYHRR